MNPAERHALFITFLPNHLIPPPPHRQPVIAGSSSFRLLCPDIPDNHVPMDPPVHQRLSHRLDPRLVLFRGPVHDVVPQISGVSYSCQSLSVLDSVSALTFNLSFYYSLQNAANLSELWVESPPSHWSLSRNTTVSTDFFAS